MNIFEALSFIQVFPFSQNLKAFLWKDENFIDFGFFELGLQKFIEKFWIFFIFSTGKKSLTENFKSWFLFQKMYLNFFWIFQQKCSVQASTSTLLSQKIMAKYAIA